jgi:hypothetical protein
VLQRSWYQMPGCSVQCKMNKNIHGYMIVWYTKGIYVSFVNCFVVIKLLNDLLITSALNPTCLLQSALNPTCLLQVNDFPTHLYLGPGHFKGSSSITDNMISSITDNMITFNGISVLNFKFKRYSL